MSLMDSVRRAEEQGKSIARRGLDLAHQEWEDVERRIRTRMRVHPRSKNPLAGKAVPQRANMAHANSIDPLLDDDMRQAHDVAAAEQDTSSPTPIVSVNGRDVHPDKIDKSTG